MTFLVQQPIKHTPEEHGALFFFTGFQSGDHIQAPDGSYSNGEKVIVIENEVIQHVWSDDAGQMKMIFEGEFEI